MGCPRKSPGRGPWRRAAVGVVAVAGCLGAALLGNLNFNLNAQEPQRLSGSGDDLALPGDLTGGEIVHPYGTNVPGECERFLEAHGRDWVVVWDRRLGTPRFVFPASPRRLALPGGVTPSEKTRGVALSFVDENAEFFGVSSADGDPGSILAPEFCGGSCGNPPAYRRTGGKGPMNDFELLEALPSLSTIGSTVLISLLQGAVAAGFLALGLLAIPSKKCSAFYTSAQSIMLPRNRLLIGSLRESRTCEDFSCNLIDAALLGLI